MAQRAALLNPPSLGAAFALAHKDAKNATPLARVRRVRAAEKRHIKISQAFEYKADLDAAEAALAEGSWPDGDELASGCWLPLLSACSSGYDAKESLTQVKWLLARGASVAATDNGGSTALHWLAKRHEYGFKEDKKPTLADIASYLIDRGADPNACDSKGRTPLYYALGGLGEELFPSPSTTMERLTGDAPAGEGDEGLCVEAARAKEAAKRPKVALALTLMARAWPYWPAPDAATVAVAEAWARAADDMEPMPVFRGDEGFQEKYERESAVKSRNELRTAKASLGRNFLAHLASAANTNTTAVHRDGDPTHAIALKRTAAAHLQASARRMPRTGRLDELQRAAADYDAAAARAARRLGAGDDDATAELHAVCLANSSECALRIAGLVQGIRRERWLGRARERATAALASAALPPSVRVKALHRRARASRDLGDEAMAASDASAALSACDDDAARAPIQELAEALAGAVVTPAPAADQRFAAENGRVPRPIVPLVLDFVHPLRYGDVATISCSWGAALRDECARAKEVRAEARRWALSMYHGGGGTCYLAPGMGEAHLLVAEYVLAHNYDRTASPVCAAVDAFLARLRVEPGALLVERGSREITFRNAEKAEPEDMYMRCMYPSQRSPTDDLDLLPPETIPYNAQTSPLKDGYGTRHQDYNATIAYKGVLLSISNYFKFSVIRNGYGTQYRLRVDAVPSGDDILNKSVRVMTNWRGAPVDVEEIAHVELDDAGTLLDFRDTYDDSRRPYDVGWRYEGDDDAYDLVTRAFFDGASFQSLGGDAAAKVEILRFLLRLLGAPCYYNNLISSYPIVESDTIWETWKYALPGAPHPDSHERELRGGQAWATYDDAYKNREAELKAAVEAQYVL